jgi:Ca2+:H+ antiporter
MGVNTGEQLDLHFTSHELMAVVLSILILAMVAQDGECHWMEGVLLLAVYVIFGMAFYHLPHGAH